VDIPNKR